MIRPDGPQLGGKKRHQSLKSNVNDHEKELAEKLGGRRQPASGATPGRKGDIKLEKFLLDSKETQHNSIIVDGRDLAKIQLEAQQIGKYPGLVLKLATGAGVSKEWAVIPLDIFADFLDLLRENNVT